VKKFKLKNSIPNEVLNLDEGVHFLSVSSFFKGILQSHHNLTLWIFFSQCGLQRHRMAQNFTRTVSGKVGEIRVWDGSLGPNKEQLLFLKFFLSALSFL
jgi:hypothetical protein